MQESRLKRMLMRFAENEVRGTRESYIKRAKTFGIINLILLLCYPWVYEIFHVLLIVFHFDQDAILMYSFCREVLTFVSAFVMLLCLYNILRVQSKMEIELKGEENGRV